MSNESDEFAKRLVDPVRPPTLLPMGEPAASAIRARLHAASPAPWAAEMYSEAEVEIVFGVGPFVPILYDTDSPSVRSEDLDLIAHAPADIAALLDDRAGLKARAEAAEGRCAAYRAALGVYGDGPWLDGRVRNVPDDPPHPALDGYHRFFAGYPPTGGYPSGSHGWDYAKRVLLDPDAAVVARDNRLKAEERARIADRMRAWAGDAKCDQWLDKFGSPPPWTTPAVAQTLVSFIHCELDEW